MSVTSRIISFTLIFSIWLASAGQAQVHLTTTSPARDHRPDEGQPCINTWDMNAQEQCEAHGLGAYNPSLTGCWTPGGLVRLHACQLCNPGERRFVHNGNWRCAKECSGSDLDALGQGCPDKFEDTPPMDCTTSARGPRSGSGNPIDHATGKKLLEEIDFEGSGPFPLRFVRHYNSMRNTAQARANLIAQLGSVAGRVLEPGDSPEPFIYRVSNATPWWPEYYLRDKNAHQQGFTEAASRHSYEISTLPNLTNNGVPQWRHNYDTRLYEFPKPIDGVYLLMLLQPTGADLRFYRGADGTYESKSGTNGKIRVLSVADGDAFDGYRRERVDGTVEEYSAGGSLMRVINPQGRVHKLSYGIARLQRVDDEFGNRLRFTYDEQRRLATLTAAYNASTTGGEDYRDYYTVHYTYVGDTDMIGTVTYPGAAGPRTYLYEDGRFPMALTGIQNENGERAATYTYRDSGYAESTQRGTNGDAITVHYAPDRRIVTNPLGKNTVYRFEDSDRRRRIVSVEGVATASCEAANTDTAFGSDGYVDSTTDARGHVTTYEYNSRGLETSRTEAAGTTEARTTSTQWHPDLALKTRVEDPLLLTQLTYNAGGLLERRVETDKSRYNAGSRTWTYSYNSDGLLVALDGPRTDVSDITSFDYNPRGLISRITNALGHVTEITTYNAWGKPARVTDANGVVSEYSYTPRGWLDTVTVDGSATTDFDYDQVGQLTRATLPNGVQIFLAYNDAGQLVEISNSTGEKISFTLDAAGNINATRILASDGALVFQQQQVFDELSRLRRQLGSNGQDYGHDYDVADNPQFSDDALDNATTRTFDALNRLAGVTDALGGVTQLGYDAHDNIIAVTDPEGVITTYDFDGFDDLRRETSPNTGTTAYGYDSAGNLTSRTDARGVETRFSWDALDRLTTVAYPSDPGLDVHYGYDDNQNGNRGIGLLTSLQDASGSAAYYYNGLGQMTARNVSIGGIGYGWAMAYDLAGNLTHMSYPSGREIRYERDARGRAAAIYTRLSATDAEETVAANFTYRPFGPVAGYLLGNGLQQSASYDLDYRLTGLLAADGHTILERGYSHDVTDNINAILDAVDASRDQAFSYDGLYRLENATGGYGSIDYQLDGTGNRLGKTLAAGEDTTIESHAYQPGSQRLLALDKLLNGSPEGSRSFGYDANGNPATLTAADGRVLDYNYGAHNRPVEVSVQGEAVARYVYDGLGQRRIKLLPEATTTHFHYAPNSQLLAETDGNGAVIREYIYAEGIRLAMFAGGSSQPPESVAVDADDATVAGTGWVESAEGSGFPGQSYFTHAPPQADLGTWAEGSGYEINAWSTTAATAGDYTLDVQWVADATEYLSGTYTISRTGAPDATVLAKYHPGTPPQWNNLHSMALAAGDVVTVTFTPRQISKETYDLFTGMTVSTATAGQVTLTGPRAIGSAVIWPLAVSVGGDYEIQARWASGPDRATDARYTVHHSGGSSDVVVNQQTNGGDWQSLGTFTLDDTSTVSLEGEGNGVVVADAVRLVWADTAANEALLATSEPQLVFFHNDHLGTPQVITGQDQEVLWKGHYLPFGGVSTDVAQVENPIRFPGQYFDAETGMHYNYFRDYDPTLGRYIQSDPLGILRDYGDPQMQIAINSGTPIQAYDARNQLNSLYNYASQNPFSNIDPFGLDIITMIADNAAGITPDTPRDLRERECTVKCVVTGEVESIAGIEAAKIVAGKRYGKAVRLVAKYFGPISTIYTVYDCINLCDEDECD